MHAPSGRGVDSRNLTHMLREIREAPRVATRLLERGGANVRAIGTRLRRRNPVAVVIAARGSSDNAALYAKYLFETRLGAPVVLAAPSVLTLLEGRLRVRGTIVIGISQSGRSTDVVAFLAAARARGALTVAVTNSARSPLALTAHETILTHAGDERSVAATKTYLNQVIALAMLGSAWAGDRDLDREISAVPADQQRILAHEAQIARIAERYRYMDACIVAARGYDFATARELALKLMEACYVVALPLSSADLLHGPIALIEHDFPVFLIAPRGRTFPHLVDVAARLRARGAETAILSSERSILRLARIAIDVPAQAADAVAPPVYGVAAQLLAYYLARTKGINPDRPRGLRKVTRTL